MFVLLFTLIAASGFDVHINYAYLYSPFLNVIKFITLTLFSEFQALILWHGIGRGVEGRGGSEEKLSLCRNNAETGKYGKLYPLRVREKTRKW